MEDRNQILANIACQGSIAIIEGSLASDSFRVLQENGEAVPSCGCTTLSEYFSRLGAYIHLDDAGAFRAFTSLQHLRDCKNSGQKQQCLFFRRKTQSGFHWSMVELHPGQGEGEEETVYILIRDIQASDEGQFSNMGSVLRALCGCYDSIYVLDLEQGYLTPYRTFSHDVPTFEAFLQTNPTYGELVCRYIAMSVFPEDRSHVTRITDLNFIRDYLTLRGSFSGKYRTVYGGEIHWYCIHYSRMSEKGELRYVAVGLSDISEEKKLEDNLCRNGKNVLVVSGDGEKRESLKAILQEEYPILTADSGEAALQLLKKEEADIAVALVDQTLPDMTGCQFLYRMGTSALTSAVPVMIAGEGMEHAEKHIQMGAEDFLCRPYRASVVKNRVRLQTRYQRSLNMLRYLERDSVTGLYSKEYFLRSGEQILQRDTGKRYAVVVSDIEHFHFFKERYGRETADKLLKNLAHISSDLLGGCLLSGRISEDVFAYLVKFSPDMDQYIQAIVRSLAVLTTEISNTTVAVKFGMYVVDEDIPVSAMCDRALVAAKSIKGHYGVDLAEFNMTLRQHLLKTQQIIENAEGSLDKEQFVVYYQPKHDIQRGGVGGAEAVVRWIHPIMGFMNPVSFIPLFEENGFIEVLDEFVLHRVCKDILEWRTNGEPVVPVSVNVSRVDFCRKDFAEHFIEIVDSYGLEHSLLHVEITESGYAEDPDRVVSEITKLHQAGFVIELDDFGTGYSFLSALNALPVDILKLDMSLLRQDGAVANRDILEFSMQLAKIMKLETIQEGVETKEQLDRVSSLGCDHVQGFYFSRPLPKEQFIAYCRNPIRRG